MKILNFGSCNIDFVYSVDHIVIPKETISAKSMQRFVGGKGLNQSVALAKAGSKVFHAGCIGEDGSILSEYMDSIGVDVKYLKTISESSGQAIIQVDENGQNSILLFPGANNCVTKEYIDSVLNDFETDDFLIIQNEINNLEYLIDFAFEKGMKIFLNPAPYNRNIDNIAINKIFCLILNEIELCEMTKENNIEKSIRLLNERYPDCKVLVTLGENGSIYSYKNRRYDQPAYNATTVDTTAAGDTFIGYFISELSRNATIKNALHIASKAAAITVSRHGAALSIPTIEEVRNINI